MRPSWWSEEEWEDLIDLRRKKKAAQTKRAYNQLINEFEKAKEKGYTSDEILNAMNSGTGWSGFKLEWMKESPRIYRMKQKKPQQNLVECKSCRGFSDCHMKGQGKVNCSLYSPNNQLSQKVLQLKDKSRMTPRQVYMEELAEGYRALDSGEDLGFGS